MNLFTSDQPDTALFTDRAMLTVTSDYATAQAMVDQLSDDAFPVDRLQIVWDGLQRVEHVTGRVTAWRAAGVGALAGAWFGGLIGWLFALYSPEGWAVFLTYLVVGAIAGAIWKGLGHARHRGGRDFGTVSTLAANEYQIWCDTDLLDRAQEVLGIRSRRAMDPDRTPPSPE